MDNYTTTLEKLQVKNKDFDVSKSFSLGNREIGKRSKNIYLKYLRKQIASYALTVGITEDFIKRKKSISSTRKNKGFKTHLSFGQILKSINKSLCSCGRGLGFRGLVP